MVDLTRIATEQRNEATMNIDTLPTCDMVRLINQEDQKVALAVGRESEHIAEAIDLIFQKMQSGGRLIYCGAGTSGRLGILDAVECPPTYSADPGLVRGLIAGGMPAVFQAAEGAEDDPELGRRDLEDIHFCKTDVLVGIAASGRTPYVLGAMRYARRQGGAVLAVTCCPGSEIDRLADVGIAPTPGAEVVAGSTRMKCGTAQKMVLNMLSTCTMIRLGKVYGNLMVDVKPSNKKLMQRCVSIVCTAAECPEPRARAALEQCEYNAKTAIVMLRAGVGAVEAARRLQGAMGRVSVALGEAKG